MAGGSGEEENYWPGYVDALTTMTMVLTFIMMVLGVVIFSLSQNISKGIIASIAKAAKLDKQLATSGSVDQLREQLVAALEQMERTKTAQALPSESQPKDRSARASDANAVDPTAGQKMSQSDTEAKTSTQSPSKTEAAAAKDQLETASQTKIVPAPIKSQEVMPTEKTQSEAERKALVSDIEQKARPDGEAKAAVSDALLTLIFPNKVFAIDPATSAEVKDFVKKSNAGDAKGKLIVRAQAYVGGGSITESRRIAYYRAMMVRKELIASGVPSEKISLHVDETSDPKRENVQIMADH
jgi:hypothetical protein